MKKSFFIILLCLLVIFFVELISFLALQDSKRHPLGFKHRPQEFPIISSSPIYNTRDIHLGWTYPNTKDGMTILEPLLNQAKNKKPIVIATLGGSTTDLQFNPHNWPLWLKKTLEEMGYNIILYNGAIAGYNSSKEQLKFLRDITPLAPDILITLSGINELAYQVEGFPFTNSYELNQMKYSPPFLLPNTFSFIHTLLTSPSSTSLGIRNPNSVAQIWINNMRSMKAVALANNIVFLPILQGALGTADRPLTLKEHKLMETNVNAYNYKESIRHYNEIRAELKNLDFIHDFTQFFVENDHYLVDLCHLSNEGNQELGRNIANIVLQTEFFTKKLYD